MSIIIESSPFGPARAVTAEHVTAHRLSEEGGTPVKADQGRIAQFFLGGFCACCCLLAGLAAAIVGVVRSICFSIWWRMQTGARGR
jgi:hypothetical protein